MMECVFTYFNILNIGYYFGVSALLGGDNWRYVYGRCFVLIIGAQIFLLLILNHIHLERVARN